MAKVTIKNCARAAAFAFAAVALAPLPASAESVVRVGMTAGDIPDWTGQPDQGFEGFRFVGWTLHDSFITGTCRARRRGAASSRARDQMDHRPQRQQALDLRAAQGREVP